jgi:release factor glutamine methyltransferase
VTQDRPVGTVSWRQLLVETTELVGDATEARWICQEASGLEGAAWVLGLDAPATVRAVARLDAMVARRRSGEPLQYVLGHWAFRSLDLLVDRRVLIPRPETEQLVDLALAEAATLPRPLTVADLGTGSGAIALALAVELGPKDVRVWATDVDPGALDVAGANLAGIGRAAVQVRLAGGQWYEALPASLRGEIGLVVSNPPYIADGDPQTEAAVREWEPAGALFAGPDGLDALREVVGGAAGWLQRGGALVCELGIGQGKTVTELAAAAGLAEVRIEPDLAGHDRFLVARRP